MKTLLKKRTSFKQAPGLMVIAYGGGIDASLTDDTDNADTDTDEDGAGSRYSVRYPEPGSSGITVRLSTVADR